MNTSILYTIQIVTPVVNNNTDNNSVVSITNDPKVVKTLVEGTLEQFLEDHDGQSRSIFTNCTIYHYYENSTMPVAHKSEIYSVPTLWIEKFNEGGLDKWA